jgi:hypothetical protein
MFYIFSKSFYYLSETLEEIVAKNDLALSLEALLLETSF